MAIERNLKILLISTKNEKGSMERCFFEPSKKQNLSFLGIARNTLEEESGIAGVIKLLRSNKLQANLITNYTQVIFKDRLEVLYGSPEDENKDVYPDIIGHASEGYDMVFVDLDNNVPDKCRRKILEASDIVVMNLSQRLSSIEDYLAVKEDEPIYKSPKTLILIGRYDKFSKYNSKNITRHLKEKNQVLTIPYNTLFFEAAEEGGVAEIFLRFRKKLSSEDRNAFFIEEVKRASESIVYRQQLLKNKRL